MGREIMDIKINNNINDNYHRPTCIPLSFSMDTNHQVFVFIEFDSIHLFIQNYLSVYFSNWNCPVYQSNISFPYYFHLFGFNFHRKKNLNIAGNTTNYYN